MIINDINLSDELVMSETNILGESKLPKNCDYEKEKHCPIAYDLGDRHERLREIIEKDFEEEEEENTDSISYDEPTRVLKRSYEQRREHMREMIRRDIEEDI